MESCFSVAGKESIYASSMGLVNERSW